MYHVVEYIKTAGSIRKEKYKTPEPPNEVARLVVKGFDNWRIGRAWNYWFRNFKGIGKRGEK
ncbi:MAG: hypothetical protein E7479_07455 [Ruminococcaceae bacterium]|nr:hypothetical protein [Oscillospiraceae bacterium]